MKYLVKNDDGELSFGSMAELRQGIQQGLVGPDELVRAEDSEIWRKVTVIPELRDFTGPRRDDRHFWFGVIALVCLTAAMAVLFAPGRLSVVKRVLVAAAFMVPVIGMSQRALSQYYKRRR